MTYTRKPHWKVGPSRSTGRRRRPGIEPLESRSLLSTIYEFPAPVANFTEHSIVAGPDGNLWFAASGTYTLPHGGDGMIGTYNPSTHAVVWTIVPTAFSYPASITPGPDGNLWFTESYGNKIGVISPTTRVITEFPVPTNRSGPSDIAAGPDGNLWFTETTANRIGSISPTTYVIAEFPVQAGGSGPSDIVAGPDGNLWFTETAANRIGSINPSTHAIVEAALPTQNCYPQDITSGPDGNLWFTENIGNKIGVINPVTLGVVETTIPTANSTPFGITSGPDGNLWFLENFNRIAVLEPTLSLSAAAGPPSIVAPGQPFGLTVTVSYQSGLADTAYNGPVTVALAFNPGGATLGGTLTGTARNGVATFTGLTLDKPGSGYRLMAYTDLLTSTLTTPVDVEPPPTIVAATVLFAGRARRRHAIGFELDFSRAMDATRAGDDASYTLTQTVRLGHRLIEKPVRFRVDYNASADSVTLRLTGRPKFAREGELVVHAQPPGGLTDIAGEALDGGNSGIPGEDGVFIIAPRPLRLSR